MKQYMDCPIDIGVYVEWEEPEVMGEDRLYPVDIKSVKFRGHEIEPYLHIAHILHLQRFIFEETS